MQALHIAKEAFRTASRLAYRVAREHVGQQFTTSSPSQQLAKNTKRSESHSITHNDPPKPPKSHTVAASHKTLGLAQDLSQILHLPPRRLSAQHLVYPPWKKYDLRSQTPSFSFPNLSVHLSLASVPRQRIVIRRRGYTGLTGRLLRSCVRRGAVWRCEEGSSVSALRCLGMRG